MKKNFRYLFCIFSSVSIMACNDGTTDKLEEDVDTLTEKIENKVENVFDKDQNASFVNDAVESNHEELHMLALGKVKGGAAVKALAKKMETDHKKIGADIMAYAAGKNIEITADTTTNNNMDNREAGADWDKDWVDMIVNDHEKDIKMFEDAADKVEDPELKQWITNTLPALRSHKDMAVAQQEKMKK